MTRIGKIARLPFAIREELNQRLENGQTGKEILPWLAANEEVTACLAKDFDGHEITDSNLSNWRLGGFRDWQDQQSILAETRVILAEGEQLSEAGRAVIADKLAVWLVGRYLLASRKIRENSEDPASWKAMRELCHDVVALRRGEHSAEWLRIERERLELQRERIAQNRKGKKSRKTAGESSATLTDDEIEQRCRQIFGMEPI